MDRYMAERSGAPARSSTNAQETASSAVLLQPPAAQAKAPGVIVAPPIPTAEDVTLLDDPSLQLLMRFLVGSAIIGVEELLVRVRKWDEQGRTDPLARSGKAFDEATKLELARYLVIGSLVWGRRWLVRTARANLAGSPGNPSPLLRSVDRVSSVWPLSTLRAPLQQVVANLSASADQRMREGWQEELAARWLADKTINEIVDDFISHLSENQELAALVRDQLNQQSIGLASTVRDTGREWSATGDDVIEAVVRRLFRRPPRRQLADSPSAAKPGLEDGDDL
jgi:hypothetical protein